MECNIPFCNNNNTISYSSGSSSKRKEKKGVKKTKGTSVKLSTDPQSVAARERRHRISDRFKILQSMVPGGSKLDTVSMLEEAIHYVKFLKTQIWLHQRMINFVDDVDEPSQMFLPEDYYSQNDNIIQHNASGSVESMQNLSQLQLPLEQFCFQGDENIKTIFDDATMKY